MGLGLGTLNGRRALGRAVIGLLPAAMLLGLAGCQVGPRNFENENDRLRAENLQLQRQVRELQQQLDLRLGELEALRQQEAAAATQPMPGAEPPVLSKIALGRYSGAVDTDNDGRDDLIRLYLQAQDQRGRSLPVAGKVLVQAVAIPDQEPPEVIAQRLYEPAELDAAWRSGFTGQHYTLELPLPDALPEGVSGLTVKITFTQANTGRMLTIQEVIRGDF